MRTQAAVPRSVHALLDGALGREWRSGAARPVEDASNLVFQLELQSGRFALRIPRIDAEVAQVDRRSECRVARLAAEHSLSPEVIACDAETGVLITRWVDGEVWTMQRARERDGITRVAALLKELHACSVPAGVRNIDLARIIDAYLERIRGMQAELALWCLRKREEALRRVADAPRTGAALCHCDVHHRNLIAGARLQLIDWEYSGRGEALFDLASYASYHELDAVATRTLLESYGAGGEAARHFVDWRWLFEYGWLLWLLATTRRTPESGTTEQMKRLVGSLLAHE